MNITKIAIEFLRNPEYPDKTQIPKGLVPEIYHNTLTKKINQLANE